MYEQVPFRRHCHGLLIAVLATLLGTSCGGSGNIRTNNSIVPDKASLTLNPATLDFGSVSVGSSQNRTGMLSAGSSDITVSSADWTGQGYSLSGIAFPVTIAAGQSRSFIVTFAPQIAGSASGSISFFSDASNSPITEALMGTGIQAIQHRVSLSWSASTSPVVGYNIYRGTQPGGPYTKLNSSPQPDASYTDSRVRSGSTYFYVVTVVGSNFVESSYSNEAKAVVPTP